MRRAGWDAWHARLVQAGTAGLHGSALVDAMVDAAGGRYYVGPSDADDTLRSAEAEGLIVRGTLAPTPSQAAAAGLSYTAVGYRQVARFYASHWWWVCAQAHAQIKGRAG